jgi:hypothetical protein
LLARPADLDSGEITDKGYVNQRQVLKNRAALIELLYADPPPAHVGLVSKLWLADDERGRYRGLYEWDGPRLADNYARALWRVLALVSVRGSIHYVVLPGLRRDALLEEPQRLAGDEAWWRLTAVG